MIKSKTKQNDVAVPTRSPSRVVSVIEAVTVTGPVKPLLMFSKRARAGLDNQEPILHSLLTTVRTATPSERPSNALMDAATAIGLNVDYSRERFACDPSVLRQMADHLRRLQPDIIESHDFKSHFLVYLLRRWTNAISGARWLAYHHGYTRMSLKVRAYQRLDSISLPNADKVITLCAPFVSDLVARGVARKNIAVIANAVEPREAPSKEALQALRASLQLQGDEVLVLTVGRLSPEKGHPELIAAFQRLVTSLPDKKLCLLIVGDGGERDALKAIAKEVGEGVRIVFTGFQADPWPYYHLADVFALPSHSEGSPLVLFEAMAAGIAIVASRVGGVPEVVTQRESALLIPPRDVDALQAALFDVITNETLRRNLGSAAKNAVQMFAPPQYSQRLLAIYSDLIASKNAAVVSA